MEIERGRGGCKRSSTAVARGGSVAGANLFLLANSRPLYYNTTPLSARQPTCFITTVLTKLSIAE